MTDILATEAFDPDEFGTELDGFIIDAPVSVLDSTGLEAFETGDAGVRDRADEILAETAFLLSTDTWTDDALCRHLPGSADLFFSEELDEIADAKRICAECPVIGPCLEGALDRAEPCGVWGGQLFVNGKIVAQKRRRGRPRKNPRPEDQLPDIPVPEYLRDRAAAAA